MENAFGKNAFFNFEERKNKMFENLKKTMHSWMDTVLHKKTVQHDAS